MTVQGRRNQFYSRISPSDAQVIVNLAACVNGTVVGELKIYIPDQQGGKALVTISSFANRTQLIHVMLAGLRQDECPASLFLRRVLNAHHM